MTVEGDGVPNSSESVSESDLKKAFHTLLLYMGESGLNSMESTVTLPSTSQGHKEHQVTLSIDVLGYEESDGS